jgi:hypothetical protein
MASADLSRRVEKVVGYSPLSEMGDQQRREFHEALLEADDFEDLPWEMAGRDPEGRAEPAESALRTQRLAEVPPGSTERRNDSNFRAASRGTKNSPGIVDSAPPSRRAAIQTRASEPGLVRDWAQVATADRPAAIIPPRHG